jgi:ATP-binding protein involved in chromosome partitioning
MSFFKRWSKQASSSTAPQAGGCGTGCGCGKQAAAKPEPQAHAKAPASGAGPSAGANASRAPQPQPTSGKSGPAALAGVHQVIAIASGKGGVGKSTVATNLAIALRHLGSSVGLLDADVYGPSQPGMLGAKGGGGKSTAEGMLLPLEKHGLRFISMGLLMGDDRPLVWRAPMAMQVINQFLGNVQWGALDYLLVDLPPGTGDVQLTLAQQARLAGAVIVTTPQEVALGIAKKGLDMFRQLNIPIFGIIENMSGFTCKHCGEETAVFKEGGGERLARELGVPFLGAIPLDPEIMLSGDDGVPVIERNINSHASESFLAIAKNVDAQARKESKTSDSVEPLEFGILPSGEVRVLWPDSAEVTAPQESLYRPFTLRVNCGCANCIDENSGRPLLDPRRVPLDIAVRSVQPVGRYGLTFSFSDGHSTGIYPFKRLMGIAEKPQTPQYQPPAGPAGPAAEAFNV